MFSGVGGSVTWEATPAAGNASANSAATVSTLAFILFSFPAVVTSAVGGTYCR
jgi:hypothetical protein